MATPVGYLLCGTPRTGSTLLCALLSSTGVLGRPQSYFREPDEEAWARRLGVPVQDGRARSYPEFVRAVRTAASTGNGVFAARVMWGSLEPVTERLRSSPASYDPSDLAVLESALGPLAFVFLHREDEVEQAVSWCRAEQTGYWQQGDTVDRPPREDLDQMTALVRTVREHNAAWRSWFDRQGVEPEHVTYEGLVADPRATVDRIAALLQVAIPARWRPDPPQRKQADSTNQQWAARLRAALGGRDPQTGTTAV